MTGRPNTMRPCAGPVTAFRLHARCDSHPPRGPSRAARENETPCHPRRCGRRSRRSVSRLTVLAALLAIVGPASAQERPAALRDVGIDQKLGARVPADLAFRDEAGREVRLGDFFSDRPVVLTLNYYDCPMLCDTALRALAGTLDVLPFEPGEDYRVVTVSIDPGETPADAVARKRVVLERLDAEGGEASWHFLTGGEKEIRELAEVVGFRYVYDEKRDEWAHASAAIVLTGDGVVSRYLYGLESAPRDLRLAIVEASKGEVGGLTDQVLLFCYRYDPETGKYSAAVMTSVRAGGLLTLLGLGTFLVVMWRRERGGKA